MVCQGITVLQLKIPWCPDGISRNSNLTFQDVEDYLIN
jgi:hypothetical protein